MEHSIFSPTGLVLVARNTQSLIQFFCGHLDSPDETDLDTAHQTELTTPCKPFPHFNLQVRTKFCVDPFFQPDQGFLHNLRLPAASENPW
jgi:hypothetical protein